MKLNRHFLSGAVCGALLTGGLSYICTQQARQAARPRCCWRTTGSGFARCRFSLGCGLGRTRIPTPTWA